MSESAARWLDRLGEGDSPVHRVDARAKLVATFVFVVCVASFPKYELAGLAPFVAFPIALLVLGHVPPRPILRLLLAASPFAVLVGIWNPLLDRAPRATLLGIAISGGALSFASIVVRFALCAGAALLLVATTPVPALLRALGQLGFPRAFVTQVQLLHRYLFVLVDEGRRLSDARALREPRRRLPRVRVGKRMVSSLLWRTWERGERIFLCMKVRGFDGRMPALAPAPFRVSDALFAIVTVGACVAARSLPIAEWIGHALLGGGAA
jgi:cobalt/nickel transport system permease protein